MLFTDGAIIDSGTIGQTTGRILLGYDSANNAVRFLRTDSTGAILVTYV